MGNVRKHIVVLTGAGVSAESGISTFRDNGGLWDKFDPQVVASIDGWRKDKALLLDFYNIRRKELAEVSPMQPTWPSPPWRIGTMSMS